MNVTYVIGNGLDIQNGLATKYSDFYKYIKKTKPNNKNQIYVAIADDPDTWADFEEALGRYTQTIEDKYGLDREKASDELHEAFNEVLEDLADYLVEQDSESEEKIPIYFMDYSDFYDGLLGESARRINIILNQASYNANFITLNYTKTLERMINPARASLSTRGINIISIHHAHGKLDEYITMGVSDESQISSALEGDSRDNLIKPRLLKSMGDDILLTTTEIIDSSDIMVIFGTSYGVTDKYIWQHIVEWMKLSNGRLVILHDRNREPNGKQIRNPIRIKQLDNDAKDRLLNHVEDLKDEEKVDLRSRILVVRDTKKLFQ